MPTIISITTLIFIVISLLVIVLFVLISKQNKKIARIEHQQNELLLLTDNLQHTLQTTVQNIDNKKEQTLFEELNQQLSEQKSATNSAIKNIEQQTEKLTARLRSLANDLEILANQQPEDKLYSRALKLAALGADIEEISQTCEIPLAEAEMLLAVHQKKPQTNKNE